MRRRSPSGERGRGRVGALRHVKRAGELAAQAPAGPVSVTRRWRCCSRRGGRPRPAGTRAGAAARSRARGRGAAVRLLTAARRPSRGGTAGVTRRRSPPWSARRFLAIPVVDRIRGQLELPPQHRLHAGGELCPLAAGATSWCCSAAGPRGTRRAPSRGTPPCWSSTRCRIGRTSPTKCHRGPLRGRRDRADAAGDHRAAPAAGHRRRSRRGAARGAVRCTRRTRRSGPPPSPRRSPPGWPGDPVVVAAMLRELTGDDAAVVDETITHSRDRPALMAGTAGATLRTRRPRAGPRRRARSNLGLGDRLTVPPPGTALAEQPGPAGADGSRRSTGCSRPW